MNEIEKLTEELTYMVEKNKELEIKIAELQAACKEIHDIANKAIKELNKYDKGN